MNAEQLKGQNQILLPKDKTSFAGNFADVYV